MNPEIEQAKQVLRNAGYQVDNLWHIDDVKQNYNCTDEQAIEVLEGALTDNYTQQMIFEAIDYSAEKTGLTRKED
jgi:muramoyltetrapeptide carboxypeptidase LdcA involved in peptidoglycan recycling